MFSCLEDPTGLFLHLGSHYSPFSKGYSLAIIEAGEPEGVGCPSIVEG